METALAIMFAGLILSCVSTVLILYFFYRYKSDFRGITQLSSALEESFKDEDTSELIYSSIDAFHSLGGFAQNANAILTHEDTLDAFMTDFAGRVRKSIVGSIMGTASGDVKKKAKAERILNEAIIDGAQQMNPILGLFLKVTGLDEQLREDPELTGYILQLVQEKGLMNLIDSNVLSLPSGQQEAAVRSAAKTMGIDF